jgi:hypothetical protein
MKPVPFNDPLFTFSEALAATGADKAWLRTFLQRDKSGSLGTKHRTGRLLFSLRDLIAIALLSELNVGLRVAPAAAWEVIDSFGPILRSADQPRREMIHLAFDGKGEVLIWTVDDAGVVWTWNERADADVTEAGLANRRPHVVVPVEYMLKVMTKAAKIAESWPEGDHA